MAAVMTAIGAQAQVQADDLPGNRSPATGSTGAPSEKPEDGPGGKPRSDNDGWRIPASFAVASFENRTGLPGLDWLAAAVPFLLAERIEHQVPLRPAYDQWVLPRGERPPADAAAVADLAAHIGASGAPAAPGADWMWTGWLAGNRAELELGVQLWRVRAGGDAALVDTAVRRAPQEQVFRMIGEAASELVARLGLPSDPGATGNTAQAAAPTEDFYAFTLFGRGLVHIAAAGADRVRLRKAQRHLARAVYIDPRLTQAQRVLGEVYRALGQHDQARARIEAALRLDPGYLPALATRAALAGQDGELDRAEDLYRALLAHRPWALAQRYELGRLLWDSERMDEAYQELVQVVAHRPNRVDARRILVHIHARRGDQDALIAELEALQRLDAAGIDDRFGLAAAYAAAGREDDALGLYQALASEPEARAQALVLLGDAYRRRGDATRASASYRRAMQAAPGDPRPCFLLAALHLEAGEMEAAAEVFRRALRFRSLAPSVHNNLGAIAHHQGHYQEAIWYLRRAVWASPRSVRYRYNHALALSAAGDLGAALAEVRAGLRIDSDHAELHYLQGVIKLRQDRLDEARTSFENALRLAPDHPDARHNLARIEALQRAGDGAEGAPAP